MIAAATQIAGFFFFDRKKTNNKEVRREGGGEELNPVVQQEKGLTKKVGSARGEGGGGPQVYILGAWD